MELKNLKGFLTPCNVLMASEKLKTLINKDVEKGDFKKDLNLDYKISLNFKEFKKIINFLSCFAESVTFSLYHHKLYIESETDLKNIRLILPIVDNNSLKGLNKDLTAINKYSLDYLKDFCKNFKNKDIGYLNMWLNKGGDYPLLIEYFNNIKSSKEWIILAPRVEND